MPKLHKNGHKKLHELNARVCQAALRKLGFPHGAGWRWGTKFLPSPSSHQLGLPVPSSALSSLDYRFPSRTLPGPGSLFPSRPSRPWLLLLRFSPPSRSLQGPELLPSSPAFLARFPPPSSAFPPGPAITRPHRLGRTHQPHLRPLASGLRLRTPARAVPPKCLCGSVFEAAASLRALDIRAFPALNYISQSPCAAFEKSFEPWVLSGYPSKSSRSEWPPESGRGGRAQ
ncbi:uncharacterized protein LOC113595338 [Acinonyx jubatus]|uniref:Uncharacterized protein LOC113595338 n=1 Tax=Acinonyx jubatus TaxID=32536 RepID=A0ABM3P3I1_ACIJB|nr:uncharacterized protein LOC113595338 [Acinonyx jubatus]